MKPLTSGRLGARVRALSAVGALLALGWGPGYTSGAQSRSVHPDTISNHHTFRNSSGRAATFSTQGAIQITGEYFQAQGSNGRSCATCHTPEDGWSITPATLQRLFDETEGDHPVFNELDANNPDVLPTITTVEERMAAYGMLLSRGVFRRGGTPRANAEWELIAADDPHGFASVSRLVHWRRPLLAPSDLDAVLASVSSTRASS
jgi:cytochrome c peroxidase